MQERLRQEWVRQGDPEWRSEVEPGLESLTALFDSNILIHLLNGVEPAIEEVDRHNTKELSIVTSMEVLVGASPESEVRVRQFLNRFKLIPINDEIAERAIIERRSRKFKLPDSILTAPATLRGAVLITRNTRDFPRNEKHVRIPCRLPVQ